MSPTISFIVPGEPVAFARAGSNGKRRYTPARQARYAEQVREAAERAMGGMPPLEGAVTLDVRAVYAVPKSWKPARKASAHYKTSAPDVDNIVKLPKDAMTGVVYRDDAQVALVIGDKIYGPYPSLTVVVYAAEPATHEVIQRAGLAP